MNKEYYQSQCARGHLSDLWILFNQVNNKVKITNQLLTPYGRQEGHKRYMFELIQNLSNACVANNFCDEQSLFLKNLLNDLNAIYSKSPEGKEVFLDMVLHLNENQEIREEQRERLLKAHKEAPVY